MDEEGVFYADEQDRIENDPEDGDEFSQVG